MIMIEIVDDNDDNAFVYHQLSSTIIVDDIEIVGDNDDHAFVIHE